MRELEESLFFDRNIRKKDFRCINLVTEGQYLQARNSSDGKLGKWREYCEFNCRHF